MPNASYKLTKEGVAELEQELDELVNSRGEVAEKIRTAREFGDLSENAEYTTAKDEQARVESRIQEIESILKNAEVIRSSRSNSAVKLGSKVEVTSQGKKESFTIVGSVEADPSENKISDESPIGKALIGKHVGDKVEVDLPVGTKTYTVKKIN